ncbi:MAG: oxidoreductase [Chloroflexi bacterium HGW-Chloroflexi-2]|jgi:sulfide:quinone oxidoreductase|nr:MAG: oxidoreductase [Chloroflexi bacterium HGW-Chloroflexi-2]
MKKIVILGAGTAGTMAANHLTRLMDLDEWQITIVDEDPIHYYQAGYIFVPFGKANPNRLMKQKKNYLPSKVRALQQKVELIQPENNKVILADKTILDYDFLVIATGCDIYPEETPGLAEHEWGKSIHSFYTLKTAVALEEKMRNFQGGRIVVNVVENPIKCPVAPMEFLMLADSYFTQKGIRDRVELIYATPNSGAFTKPVASKLIGDMLDRKNINVEADFYIDRADPDAKKIISYDERELEYDLLVSVPLNKGSDVIGKSGLGDDLNYVAVNKSTFLSDNFDNIFVLGDAANAPTSKAGAVAHYATEMFVENFKHYIEGKPLEEKFDGHTNCFIESGYGKGVLLDFNYEQEPLPGRFPVPGIGPFALLQESRLNHIGKLSFEWMYWNILMHGRKVPLAPTMSMAGKWTDWEKRFNIA